MLMEKPLAPVAEGAALVGWPNAPGWCSRSATTFNAESILAGASAARGSSRCTGWAAVNATDVMW